VVTHLRLAQIKPPPMETQEARDADHPGGGEGEHLASYLLPGCLTHRHHARDEEHMVLAKVNGRVASGE